MKKKNHKARIIKLIETHQTNVKNLKDKNLAAIRNLQD